MPYGDRSHTRSRWYRFASLAKRARPPSRSTEKTLITKHVTTHISTVIKSLFEKFLGYEKRESSSPVRTVGAPTPTTRSTFGSHLRARRVGEAELNNALYSNHVITCIHTVHRHKRCYECCCYAFCHAMQCHSRTQIHWREWQRTIGALLDYSVDADFRLSSSREGNLPPRSYLGCIADRITKFILHTNRNIKVILQLIYDGSKFFFFFFITQYRDFFANCIAMRIACNMSQCIDALVNDTDWYRFSL